MSSPFAAACQQIERASHTTAGQSLILPSGKISHQKVPKSIIQTYETALPGAEETSRCPSATLAAQLQALGRAREAPPMRRTRSCPHAASGHAAAPPSPAMNARRRRVICPSSCVEAG